MHAPSSATLSVLAEVPNNFKVSVEKLRYTVTSISNLNTMSYGFLIKKIIIIKEHKMLLKEYVLQSQMCSCSFKFHLGSHSGVRELTMYGYKTFSLEITILIVMLTKIN